MEPWFLAQPVQIPPLSNKVHEDLGWSIRMETEHLETAHQWMKVKGIATIQFRVIKNLLAQVG